MKLGKITLKNFRVYKGKQIIDFTKGIPDKRIHLIAGKNGYGKTSFLTSLIWGLYGKHMVHVEEQYKRDIRNAGGYHSYRERLFNDSAKYELENNESNESKFYVELEFIDVFIPSLPCKSIKINRSYDLSNNKEDLRILIDGDENELTKEVGFETFINDYILPRDIAKFFFFDAEKIVSLAEAKSIDELKALSRAYSEVLGIKKYEDLKRSLKSLMLKLKKNGATGEQREIYDDLLDRLDALSNKIIKKEQALADLDDEIEILRSEESNIQEMLIREGNSITMEELIELKRESKIANEDLRKTKNKLKSMLMLLPFIIAKKSFQSLIKQIKLEQSYSEDKGIANAINIELIELKDDVSKFLVKRNVYSDLGKDLIDLLEARIKPNLQLSDNRLLNFDDQTSSSIISLYDYLESDFKEELTELRDQEKRQKHIFYKINRQISEAEARKDNPDVVVLRKQREKVIENIEKKSIAKGTLIEELIELNRVSSSVHKQLSEKEKGLNIIKQDIAKYKTTDNLLAKVSTLITRIKDQKKLSLEGALQEGLSELMHKDLVKGAQVSISEEILDIELIDKYGKKIRKDTLSKGEQQLYASALLKALVSESGINFPVFIDSPMQKFDKHHSKRIIQKFYPNISEQVVIFPLLEKELTKDEFNQLEPHLKSTFYISHGQNGSQLHEISIDKLFNTLNETDVYSYQN